MEEIYFLKVLRGKAQRAEIPTGNPMFVPVATAYINVLDVAGFEVDYPHTFLQGTHVRMRVVSSRYPQQFFFIDIPRGREMDNELVVQSWIHANFDGILNEPGMIDEGPICGAENKNGAPCRLTLHHLTLHMGAFGRIWTDEQPAVIADEAREAMLLDGITVP